MTRKENRSEGKKRKGLKHPTYTCQKKRECKHRNENWKSIDFFCLLLSLHFVFLNFYYFKWIVPTIPVLHTVHHSLGYITYINLEQY